MSLNMTSINPQNLDSKIAPSNQITQQRVPRAQSSHRSVGVGAVFTLPQQRSQVGGQGQRDAAIQAIWPDQMFGHSSSIAIRAGLVYRPLPTGRTYAHQHRRHIISPFRLGFLSTLQNLPTFRVYQEKPRDWLEIRMKLVRIGARP